MEPLPWWDPVRKGLVVTMPSKRMARVLRTSFSEVTIKYLTRPKDTVTFNIDWFETRIVSKSIYPEYMENERADIEEG